MRMTWTGHVVRMGQWDVNNILEPKPKGTTWGA
jgi:hypothetical protein